MIMKENYSGVLFDVELDESDKFYLFLSPSGTGKTFLFNTLNEHLKNSGIGSVLINGELLNNLQGDSIIIENSCLSEDVDVVILDNADLYLTQSFLDLLQQHNKRVLISLKDISRFSFKNFGFYKVMYKGDTLKVRRKI